jgi:DNA-binding GntR family transcriptional regulator
MADTDTLIKEWEASPHKTHKIAAGIARKITTDNMHRYDELPTNSRLAAEWDVSERTITAAKTILGNHGILILENRRYYVAFSPATRTAEDPHPGHPRTDAPPLSPPGGQANP